MKGSTTGLVAMRNLSRADVDGRWPWPLPIPVTRPCELAPTSKVGLVLGPWACLLALGA